MDAYCQVKGDPKDCVLCDYGHVTFWKRHRYGDSKKEQRLQGFEGRGGAPSAAEFRDGEAILYGTVLVNTWHFTKAVKQSKP